MICLSRETARGCLEKTQHREGSSFESHGLCDRRLQGVEAVSRWLLYMNMVDAAGRRRVRQCSAASIAGAEPSCPLSGYRAPFRVTETVAQRATFIAYIG